MTNNMSQRSSLSDQLRIVAAFLGGSGVALGAYGAHGLVPKYSTMDQSAISMLKENWKTAVMYQLIHAASILTISAIVECKEQAPNRAASTSTTSSAIMLHQAGQVMAVGTALFSGSIYMLCLNIGPKYIWGPTTPIGGMLMIAGWVMMLSSNNNRSDGEKMDKL
jgi:uncharacterized membrane protein YgdD (TMEM256/DUF423 family)